MVFLLTFSIAYIFHLAFSAVLGFEPMTLGFEAQVHTTLATEARLLIRVATMSLCFYHSQGFALASIVRSLLVFC